MLARNRPEHAYDPRMRMTRMPVTGFMLLTFVVISTRGVMRRRAAIGNRFHSFDTASGNIALAFSGPGWRCGPHPG